jgi:hypothetical protein
MKCPRCGKPAKPGAVRCPSCGHQPKLPESGVFQTSTVLVFSSGSEGVYRSVEEVPAPLRARLLRSTSGVNSATLLIADRRGRREIARAMRGMPAPLQRRLVDALLAAGGPLKRLRLTLDQKISAAALLLSLASIMIWLALR